MDTTQEQKDELAGVVVDRYRRAKEYREGHMVVLPERHGQSRASPSTK